MFEPTKGLIFTKIYPRGVAQLVEHWSPKPGVASSSLAAPAITFLKPIRAIFLCPTTTRHPLTIP